MSMVGSCGHTFSDSDGPEGMGYNLAVKSLSREGSPAVAYVCVCQACARDYRDEGQVLESWEAEMAYLAENHKGQVD